MLRIGPPSEQWKRDHNGTERTNATERMMSPGVPMSIASLPGKKNPGDRFNLFESGAKALNPIKRGVDGKLNRECAATATAAPQLVEQLATHQYSE